jgi:hypothetical protein
VCPQDPQIRIHTTTKGLTTMTHSRWAALTLAAITLAASGCGKSSKPLTRAELVAKADTICRRVNNQLKSSNNTISSQRDIARIAPRLASFEQTALAELSKLVPPMPLANDWKTIIAGAQTLADNTAKLGEYAKENNIKAAKGLISTSQKVQQEMLATAKRDGFKDCSETA